VSGLFAGPADLALSLGLTLKDGLGDPLLEDALARILAVCRHHARIPGLFTESAGKAVRAIRQGYRLVGVGLDFRFLGTAAAAHLAAVKGL
jgi:2-keto-3-deoxy-L-rhamnonate aldolase RhmA